MLVVAFISFSLFTFVGDPINNMVGEETSDEERTELRESLGLNDPVYIQFSRFVVNATKTFNSLRRAAVRLRPGNGDLG